MNRNKYNLFLTVVFVSILIGASTLLIGLNVGYSWTGTQNTFSPGYMEVESLNASSYYLDDTQVLLRHVGATAYVGFNESLAVAENYWQVDGTADNVQLQAAIDYAGSGKVVTEEGDYFLAATLSITTTRFVLEGMGHGTIFNLANGVNDNVINITGSGVTQVQLKNFRIWGNRGNQTAGDGIYISTPYVDYDTMHVLSNLDISDVYGDGVEIAAGDTRAIWMERIHTNHVGDYGILLRGSDHQLKNCQMEDADKAGILISGSNHHLTDCKAFGCGEDGNYAGFHFDEVYNIHLVQCEAQENRQMGFFSENSASRRVFLIGCIGYDNGANASGNREGANFYDATDFHVTGGSYCDVGAGTQTYGIRISGSSVNCSIIGAWFEGNTVAGISTTGTDIEVHHTLGFVTENSGSSEASNDDWIAHGLSGEPTYVKMLVNETDANYFLQLKATNSTHFQIYLYDATAGVAEAVDKTILWDATYEP